MKRLATAIAMASSVALPAAAREKPAGAPLSVYVSSAEIRLTAANPDRAAALKARKEETRQARRVLENELKEHYGKARKAWPADRAAELYRLEQVEAVADAEYEYRKTDPGAMMDAAGDIAQFLREKSGGGRVNRVTLVPSAAEADLVVQVAACRSSKSFPTQNRPDRCYVLFTVGAGGGLDPRQFAKVPLEYREKKFGTRAWGVAGPRRDDPVFYFESYNGGGKEFGCSSAAASAASAAIDKFIEENYRILTAR